MTDFTIHARETCGCYNVAVIICSDTAQCEDPGKGVSAHRRVEAASILTESYDVSVSPMDDPRVHRAVPASFDEALKWGSR